MRRWVKDLDRILRGEATRLPALHSGLIDISAFGLCVVLTVLGIVYGLCMGIFSLLTRGNVPDAWSQVGASAVKVPALFLLTLLITFPSLYVFNALVGSRLSILSVLRLLVAALAVMLTVLASFGPIVAFFSVSTTSYPFMKLLNVVMFAVAGFLGLAFLLQTMHRLTVASAEPPPLAPPPELPVDPTDVVPPELPPELPVPGALDRTEGHVLGSHVRTVFRVWVIVFGLVGAQMSWVLRPFIGDPQLPFSFFRERQSNFFEAVWRTLVHLVGG